MKQGSPNFFQTTVVLLLFFASGALGLIYEVVWSRMMMHVFGSTAIAVGTGPLARAIRRGGTVLGDKAREAAAEFGEIYLEGVTGECLNEIDLKEWLRNSPAKKPMYTDPEKLEPTDGLVRGMPYLALSEDQIDRLVAYLLERK